MKNVAKNVVLKIVLRAALSVRPKNNIFKNKEQVSDQLASNLAFLHLLLVLFTIC